MSEKPVRIAISIKDRVARQLACGMFSSAGAGVQLCDDAAAILAVAEDMQGIVLELAPAVDETIDALVLLRQHLATMPIYVIANAAEQRHAKRLKSFGATQVIPHEELQRRVGHLVQEIAKANQIDDWGVRSPGWGANRMNEGYDVQSMDMGAWLSIPGNRRLLGLEESSTAPNRSAAAPPPRDGQRAADQPQPPQPPQMARTPSAANVRAEDGAERPPLAAFTPGDLRGPSEPAVAPPRPVVVPPSEGRGEGVPCGLADCPHLVACREEHKAQNAAILESHIQREKRLQEMNQAFRERLQADLRGEMNQLIKQRNAAGEAKSQQVLNERVRQGVAVAMRRVNLMLGLLAGVLAVLIALGSALAWRLWPWP